MDSVSIQIQTVLYFNPRENLERSMDSIAKAAEICVKDGGCLNRFTLYYGDSSSCPTYSEEDLYWLNEKYKDSFTLKYQYFGLNSGTSKGHNIMAENCTSDYIMTINPDIILAPNFFLEIMKPFDNPRLKAGMSEARQTPIEHPKNYDRLTGETSWCTGACTVIPTNLYKEVGGYDEDTFFLYCDDVDLSWRIRMLGYKGIYCPSAVIYHAKDLDCAAQVKPTPAELYYSAEAALLMSHKWSNPSRLRRLLSQMKSSGDPNAQKAAAAFLTMQKNGNLPEPLDPEHEVAEFIGDNYTKHRFVM